MKTFQYFIAVVMLLASSASRAEVIDFVKMIETDGWGESGWTTLTLNYADFSMDITGDNSSGDAFAYLDWNHAGLGVCGDVNASNQNKKRPGNSSNVCNPASDDNVTVGESLTFSFNTNVIIEKIWFNNTHDPDLHIDADDLVTINGVDLAGPGNGYAPTSSHYNTVANHDSSVDNYLSGFSAGPGSDLVIAFNNQQFYISGMEITAVPAPAMPILFGMALIGLGIIRRRRI